MAKIAKVKIGGLMFDMTGGGIGGGMIETTYADLVSARDSGNLVPGTYYRITDYVTTTSQSGTTAATHPFDVVVLSLSENTLSEQAMAMHSERDTQGYFENSNVEAWQLWYCLDNDTDRFEWASSSGKGVIYRMIDENENDCPYDFKNIMFARYFPNYDGGDVPQEQLG